ncbi:phosphopantothenoylcysteine decarboxylase [Thomasclavelia cocleata]|uniref:phosphopantothenoylcysteine decarboxylase domain-containing protein n=1 Tax=Thomasclavelia cocleata TaxID=69824 RepID=UPI00256EC9FD|nr:phosphopantothenoylcysteine decarboxylase [Thomasclavelia cocleata]
MINVVITSGGTSEPIDRVRKITNSSTGRLGANIANKLIQREDIGKIFYITTKKAIKPQIGVLVISGLSKKLEIIEIETTLELKKAVENVLLNNKVDYFIHAMAVSDYYVDYVSTSSKLANELKDSTNFEETLKNPINKLEKTEKISSYEDNLIVVLKQTPKIIGLIKEISPNTHLFGFKLLDSVSEEYLIEVASKLRDKNNCDYVIANDLENIRSGNHRALIIDKFGNIEIEENKDNIAINIANKIREV